MMSRSIAIAVIVLQCFAHQAFAAAEQTDAAQAEQPRILPEVKKSKKASTRQSHMSKSADSAAKPPSQLPKFKGKRKLVVNFDEAQAPADNHPAVVIRSELPVQAAVRDQKEAELNFKAATSRPRPTPSKTVLAPVQLPEVDRELTAPTFTSPKPQTAKLDANQEFDFKLRARDEKPPEPAAPPAPPVVAGPPRPIETSPPPIEAPTPPIENADAPVAEPQEMRTHPQLLIFEEPQILTQSTRLVLGGSYLNARYSQLESDLKNGATGLSIGVAKTRGAIEGSLSLELGQGLDQAVTLQNTRYSILRADSKYLILQGGMTPTLGIALGYGYFNVFSYHSSDGGKTLILIENAQVSALVAAPSVGARFLLGASLTLDLSVEYLALVGTSQTTALGGWTGALSVGIPF